MSGFFGKFRHLGKTLGGVSEGEALRVLSAIATAAGEQFMEGRPFSVEGLGTFSLSIHGSFSEPDALWNNAVNKVNVGFRADKEIVEAANSAPRNRLHGVLHGPVIDYVIDNTSNTANTRLTSGCNIKLMGHGIKLVGEGAGLVFTAVGGQDYPVTMTNISHNGPTEIIFICPSTPADTIGNLSLKTRYSSSKKIDGGLRSYIFPTELIISAS